MKILSLILLLVFVWMAFEIWRAPLMEETEDGRLITKRPTRKFSDLFKQKKTSGSFKDLEKIKRGRSKY